MNENEIQHSKLWDAANTMRKKLTALNAHIIHTKKVTETSTKELKKWSRGNPKETDG